MTKRFAMLSGMALLGALSCARPSGTSSVEHWVVVGHHAPGISAMTDAEAAQWHGRSIDLGPDLAFVGTDSCDHPMYASRRAPADSVLMAFQIAPGSLGPTLPPGAIVTLTEVTCAGETWYSAGALLIKTSPTHAFTPWEGVFFELEKR